jgi:hypothetical protein
MEIKPWSIIWLNVFGKQLKFFQALPKNFEPLTFHHLNQQLFFFQTPSLTTEDN